MAKFSRTRAYQLIRDDLNPSAFVLSLPTSRRPPNPVIIEALNHWRRVTHETPHGSNTYTNAVACALF